MGKKEKLQKLIEKVAAISYHSTDIYWVGTHDFKNCVFLNNAYEKTFCYPKDAILRDFKIISTYLTNSSRGSYDPFLEMPLKIKKGYSGVFSATYSIIRGGDGRIRTISDHGQLVYDAHGEHIGFTGVARDISSDLIRQQLPVQMLKQFPSSDKKKYYLKGKYKKIYLSSRQAECAFYLIQGKTAKQTAQLLNLSPRTIEHIHLTIKNKLGVNYRSDVFDTLIEADFIEVLMDD